MSICRDSVTGHDFKIIKKQWQTVDYVRYQRLNHSIELMVCDRCGEIVDPFQRLEVKYPTPRESSAKERK